MSVLQGIKGSFKKRNAKGILKAPFETADSEEAVMKDNQVITSEQDAPVARETRSKKSKIEGTQPGQSKMETRRFSLYSNTSFLLHFCLLPFEFLDVSA